VCWGCEIHDDYDDYDGSGGGDGDVRVEIWLYINKYVC
jgi:hypothetical protein